MLIALNFAEFVERGIRYKSKDHVCRIRLASSGHQIVFETSNHQVTLVPGGCGQGPDPDGSEISSTSERVDDQSLHTPTHRVKILPSDSDIKMIGPPSVMSGGSAASRSLHERSSGSSRSAEGGDDERPAKRRRFEFASRAASFMREMARPVAPSADSLPAASSLFKKA